MSDIDLTPFCSKDEHRSYITKPFSRDGFTWATNGHILVRVPLRDDVPVEPKTLNPVKIMAFHDGATFAMLPPVKWPETPPADKCEACEGRGTEHDCPECHCTCDACDGSGLAPAIVSVRVRGVFFDVKYIRMVMALPGAEFTQKPTDGPCPFRFDGGLGVLMPLRIKSDEPDHIGDFDDLERA